MIKDFSLRQPCLSKLHYIHSVMDPENIKLPRTTKHKDLKSAEEENHFSKTISKIFLFYAVFNVPIPCTFCPVTITNNRESTEQLVIFYQNKT